ncbi:MAG: CRISPR-associated helicase Cas3', partial [Pseudomonadota bacterium]|nr:CRISPR-associated helicase Cas3' [Pseudomonadota bacterium]
PSLEQLKQQLDHYLSQSRFQSEEGINATRKRILTHVRKQSELTPGLFTLNVPTGGGKTLSSLGFALDHAVKHGLRRVILVIPFTSIVEQNAQVWRDALGSYGEEAVLEHHSAFDQEKMDFSDPKSKDKLRLAAENWEAPIVVTTAVQFFESLFANRSSRCRKLHNIANSVVILDEAQTLPVKLLRPCVAMIKEMSANYCTSVVVCTATQPALTKESGFADGLEGVRELAPDPEQLHQELERVAVTHVGPKTDEELVDELMVQQQVLCIVNNRRHARSLFDRMRAEGDGVYHLTTLMCAEHRSAVLDDIRKKLKAGETVRLISTSLIEAGVDVDFPIVYRAEAGLDSVAQAAGRCNREGRYSATESLVRVFQVADDWAEPPELTQYASAFRSVYRNHTGKLLLPEAVEAYFKEVYWMKGKELDHHNLLTSVTAIDRIPYERMAKCFSMIESNMQPVIVQFNKEAEKLVASLSYADKAGSIARKLQRYLVQVPEQGLKALMKAGAVAPVNEGRFGYQFLVLENYGLYSKEAGLSWDEPEYIASESLSI